ncbi:hypothetical protein SFUMM280S_08209 [Streptomyces fumanus]
MAIWRVAAPRPGRADHLAYGGPAYIAGYRGLTSEIPIDAYVVEANRGRATIPPLGARAEAPSTPAGLRVTTYASGRTIDRAHHRGPAKVKLHLVRPPAGGGLLHRADSWPSTPPI